LKRINLCLGVHNHQPVGNFDFVFEEAYQKAYLPFLELLERHPHVRLALHCTGILFEWIKNNKPDYILRLRKLVQSRQVEMMTGGYYEPILAVIPDEDKLGQIRKLTQFIKKQTGYEATGMWLAERIWEPHLPKPLAEAGVRYVVLDDSHFRAAGLAPEKLLGYFVTEELGHSISLFPISERLRYNIPFQEPEATVEYLHNLATEDGSRVVVFADDGEKFGIWPGTHKHCYEDQWLDRFFTALEQNREWISLLHFTEALQNFRPVDRVYLPTASYREMMEWAMPSGTIHRYEEFENLLRQANWFEPYKDFVRGSFWRNFMAKYPEINNMHKKMLLVSRRLNKIRAKGNYAKLQKAKDHLWASQCNCPYWHGLFGGAYLNNLRYANYHEMLQAEAIVDDLEHPAGQDEDGWVDISEQDMDADNEPEILVSTKSLNVYLKPQLGGSIFELDYKPKAINLSDTLSRREEAYHRKLHQQPGMSSRQNYTAEAGNQHHPFAYDWYRRTSLVDHFLRAETTLAAFAAARYGEQGDFVDQPFTVQIEQKRFSNRVILSRRGRVWIDDSAWPVEIQKTLAFDPRNSGLAIDYVIKNLQPEPVTLHFGTEFVFALLAGKAIDRCYVFPGHELSDCHLGSIGMVDGAESVKLVDEWLDFSITLETPGAQSIWRFPIETISQSESGFERVYQSSVVFPNWQIQLSGHGSWTNRLALTIA
jgi:alpha-amylase